jgi:hypothetical protein
MAREIALGLRKAGLQMSVPNTDLAIDATVAVIDYTDMMTCVVAILLFTNHETRLADNSIHQ